MVDRDTLIAGGIALYALTRSSGAEEPPDDGTDGDGGGSDGGDGGGGGGGGGTNKAPTASFTASQSGTDPLLWTFDASGSSDPDGQIVEYKWGFDSVSGVKYGEKVDVSFPEPGQYGVTVHVTDDAGSTATAADIITIESDGGGGGGGGGDTNDPPVAKASIDGGGGMVWGDGSASYDPDGFISSYEWEVRWVNGDGTVFLNETFTGESFEWAVGDGTANVTLTVTDGDGATDQYSKQGVVTGSTSF